MEGKEEERVSCKKKILSSIPLSLFPLYHLPDRRQEGDGLPWCFLHHHGAKGLEEEDDRSSSSSRFGEPGEGGGRDDVEELGEGGREGGREGRR